VNGATIDGGTISIGGTLDAAGTSTISGATIDIAVLERAVDRESDHTKDSSGDIARAYAPYLIIIAVFAIAQIGVIKTALAKEPFTHMFSWPGLHVVNPKGEVLKSITYTLNWLPAAGTLLLIAGVITMFVLGVTPKRAAAVFGASLNQLKFAILTVATVLGLAYLMNQSGQTITLGKWIAGAGGIFAFLSGLIGWLGVSVNGSGTSPDEQLRRRARQDDLARRTWPSARQPWAWEERRACCSARCSAGASCWY